MEITGTIKDFNLDYKTRKAIVTLLLDSRDLEQIEKLSKLEKLRVTIKKFFKKRSNDANKYFWKLLQELCELAEIDTMEEYIRRVKELGIFRRFRIEKDNVDTFIKMWEDKGIAWFCEIYDTEYIGNEEFKIINAYYGSSSFNTKQMCRLIDGLVQDCKSVGIETKPQKEIDSLLRSWGK